MTKWHINVFWSNSPKSRMSLVSLLKIRDCQNMTHMMMVNIDVEWFKSMVKLVSVKRKHCWCRIQNAMTIEWCIAQYYFYSVLNSLDILWCNFIYAEGKNLKTNRGFCREHRKGLNKLMGQIMSKVAVKTKCFIKVKYSFEMFVSFFSSALKCARLAQDGGWQAAWRPENIQRILFVFLQSTTHLNKNNKECEKQNTCLWSTAVAIIFNLLFPDSTSMMRGRCITCSEQSGGTWR